jgi:hypothetical protein
MRIWASHSATAIINRRQLVAVHKLFNNLRVGNKPVHSARSINIG